VNLKPCSTAPRVLVVGPRSTIAHLESTSDALPATDFCSDVYRALAKLLNAAGDAYVGVVVQLDGVGPRELAFFSILARSRRGLRILVQAGAGGESKIAKALQAGATGVLTAEFWREFAPRPAMPAPIEVRVTADPPTVQLAPPESDPGVETVEEDEAPPVEEDSEDTPSSPRVPWLRYADGPQRAAPPVRKPPAPIPPAPAPSAPAPDYEPLLTDEELEALLSDDISAIAPRPTSTRRRDERPEGGRP